QSASSISLSIEYHRTAQQDAASDEPHASATEVQEQLTVRLAPERQRRWTAHEECCMTISKRWRSAREASSACAALLAACTLSDPNGPSTRGRPVDSLVPGARHRHVSASEFLELAAKR